MNHIAKSLLYLHSKTASSAVENTVSVLLRGVVLVPLIYRERIIPKKPCDAANCFARSAPKRSSTPCHSFPDFG